MALAKIFEQLKELEKKFNETKYPPEEAFQPDFCFRILKAERDSLKHDFSVYRMEDLLEVIEK